MARNRIIQKQTKKNALEEERKAAKDKRQSILEEREVIRGISDPTAIAAVRGISRK